MRYDKLPQAEARENDPPAITNAITALIKAGADVRRPNPYQLKVTSDLNFYPTKGTIMKDGDTAPLPQRGLDQLIALLRESGALPFATSDHILEV